MKDAKKLVEFFSAMSAVDRFSQFRLVNPESILEHTGMVAIMTLMICQKVDANIDVELAALRHAMCHDIDEILTGDIPMPTKYSNQSIKNMIDDISYNNIMIIDRSYGTELTDYWTTPARAEKAIVKLADVIAVYYKARQEIDLFGNKTMISAIQILPDGLARSAEQLKRFYPNASDLYDLVDEMISWTVRTIE